MAASVDTRSQSHSWHAGVTPSHWRVLGASFLGWIFDGFEAFALFLVLPFALKSLLSPEEAAAPAVWAGIAISSTLLGWGLGGLVGGVLADYVGRKRMMMYSVLFYALFSGVTAFSQTFWMLAALRFLTGLALGSEWSTGVALVAESWPDGARPKGCGILQSGFGWGTLLAAVVWLVLGTFNPLGGETWRIMFLVGGVPALFVLYIRRAVNESERWLKAVREQRWSAVEVEAGQAAGVAAASANRPFTLTEIFREPESRRRILLAFLLSLATTVGWWAISSWLPVYTGQLAKTAGYANPQVWGQWSAILYTIGAVLAYMASGFIADAIGRRPYLFLTYLGALIMTPVTYLWTHDPQIMLGVALVNGFFTLGCAYSWMAIYLVELFTSTVRSTAASFVFNATRLVAWLFPILAGTIISSFGGIPKAAMVLGSIYVLGLILPWFMPETRGKPLPP